MEHKMVGMIFDNKITITLPLEILLHALSKHQIYRRMEERKLIKPMRKQKLHRSGKWREICYILKNCIRTPDKKNGWHLLWELMYVCMYVCPDHVSQPSQNDLGCAPLVVIGDNFQL
jgi:hypothetical protein